MFPSPFDLSAVTEDADYEETSRIYRFGTPRILDQDTLALGGAVCLFLFREDPQSSGLWLNVKQRTSEDVQGARKSLIKSPC